MGLSDRSNLLFSNLDLRASLDARRQAIDSEVRALDPNRLLNTSPDDLARFFVEKYHMEPPALYRDQWSVESKEETETREDYGHRFTATVQRLYVHIPFVGDRDLFMSRASTFTMSPPRGVAGAQTLTLAFTPGQQGGPEAVRALIDREIDEVERHLAWIRNDLEAYNGKRSGDDASKSSTSRAWSLDSASRCVSVQAHRRRMSFLPCAGRHCLRCRRPRLRHSSRSLSWRWSITTTSST